jgi:T5SS/PEP-CTERM-associated repeat protein/probable HAF family extracellular repeat protein
MLLLVAGHIGRARASTSYNVIDLGSLGGSFSQAKAISGSGEIAGEAYLAGNSAYHTALWTNSSTPAIDLGTLGGPNSQAYGINASGLVVGSAFTNNSVQHAALWTNANSTAIDLGTLGGTSSQANGINASGQIIGSAGLTGDTATHAALWTNSSSLAIDLGTLGGTSSQANDINSSGQIVGSAYTTGDVTAHAALWTNSSSPAIDLGTLGGSRSQANGINDSGQIVGAANLTGDTASHAALWTNSSSLAIDLGTLGGTFSQANSINSAGQMVGWSNLTNGSSHAVLWTSSASPAVDLNSLIPTNSGWVLSYPYAINDSGEIVGYGTIGGTIHAFALIPIPQNTTTNTWISAFGDKWEASTNWSNGTAPSLTDWADTITNANTKVVTIDSASTNTPGVMTVSNLIISAPLGSTNTLLLNSAGAVAPLQILNTLTVGSGGVLTVNGSSLIAGSVSNAGVIQASGGTLTFFGPNIGTNNTLSGSMVITNGGTLLLTGTDSWTLVSSIAYGGGASGGSIISSNSGATQSVFLSNPAFCNNAGTLAVVGGNVINYGQIGGDLTNNYVIAGSGSLTGSFGPNSYAILNQGTIATLNSGTLVLDPRDALDFGGVQNLSAMVVASASTLSIRRTESAWDNPGTSYPTNFGTIFMQGGVLRADDATTTSTNRVYVNGISGVIEGCGTFSNWTTVVNNGLILANCGTTLTFSAVVTNNGTMRAANGNVLEAYGTVVNNGTIDIINGGVTNFHGGFINNGTVVLPTNSWIAGSGKWETAADWSSGFVPSTSDLADLITNAGNNTVTIDAITTNTPGAMTINSLTVAAPLGSTNTLALSNAGTISTPFRIQGAVTLAGGGVITITNSEFDVDNTGGGLGLDGLVVGVVGPGNALAITNGGRVFNDGGSLGYWDSSSNNVVLVTGAGSVWSNGYLCVGFYAAGNQLTIDNGGQAVDGNGYLGMYSTGSNNVVLVTGPGSVWNNLANLFVGVSGVDNQLTVANGGQVVNQGYGYLSQNSTSSNNVVLVTGAGSVWSNSIDLYVGFNGPGNQLTIANGGQVADQYGYLGMYSTSSNNIALVTGAGSVWSNQAHLYVGAQGAGNQLTVTNDGAVFASNLYIGNSGTLVLAGGTVNMGYLVLNNPGSAVVFNSGTINSVGANVYNYVMFVAGDGLNAATYNLQGGVHTFARGLRICNSASLTGCGTVTGNVTVDPGGMVLTTCGSLVFGGIVTNNGSIVATNGMTITFDQLVVNYGVITGSVQYLGGVCPATITTSCSPVDGGTTTGGGVVPCGSNATVCATANPGYTFINWTRNGSVVSSSSCYSPAPNVPVSLVANFAPFLITSISLEGSNVLLTWKTTGGGTNFVQAASGDADGSYDTNGFMDISTPIVVAGSGQATTNFLDAAGATQGPSRYYRIRSGSLTNQDSVGDGIPNWWRIQYFPNQPPGNSSGTKTNDMSCASCDADETGQDNYFKYVAGLNPTNPTSVFVLQIANVSGVSTQMNLIFNPIVSGRTYTPQYCTNLTSGAYTNLTGYSGPVTNLSRVTVTDQSATQAEKFYRINISLP